MMFTKVIDRGALFFSRMNFDFLEHIPQSSLGHTDLVKSSGWKSETLGSSSQLYSLLGQVCLNPIISLNLCFPKL